MEGKKMQKCRKRIIHAFMELRAHREIEKITIVELVAKADVNKSTFYAYYHDIYDLSEQLQEEVIDRIASAVPHPENIIKDIQQFTRDVLFAYEKERMEIRILFSGSQSSRLPMMVKNKIMEMIREYITAGEYDERKISVIANYKIYGAYYAYIEETGMNEMQKIDYISKLTGGLLPE